MFCMATIRKALKTVREQNKMTQEQVAVHLGIKVRAYQNIEYGKALGSIKHWDRLEDLFGIPQRSLREITTDKVIK